MTRMTRRSQQKEVVHADKGRSREEEDKRGERWRPGRGEKRRRRWIRESQAEEAEGTA